MNTKYKERRLDVLKLHKRLRNDSDYFKTIYKLICYSSIDSFVENATDKEYEIITERCISIYLKVDECDLIKLADEIAYQYANHSFTLENLNEMNDLEIIALL